MVEKISQWLQDNKSASILFLSILVVFVVFLWIDLPLVKWALKKGWRVYQLSKLSESLVSMDREIEEEKDRNVKLNEKITRARLGQATGGVTAIIDLINESARLSKINILSVNSYPANDINDHHRFPFEISLDGKYHDFGQFLNLIENSGYAVNFYDLTISTKDATSFKLEVRLKLNVFFMKG